MSRHDRNVVGSARDHQHNDFARLVDLLDIVVSIFQPAVVMLLTVVDSAVYGQVDHFGVESDECDSCGVTVCPRPPFVGRCFCGG